MNRARRDSRAYGRSPTGTEQSSLSKFPEPATVLARVVEDPNAPTAARVKALKLIERPGLLMLRRLLHRSRTPDPSRPPVPSKLLAAAALAYAKEVSLRKIRPARPPKTAPA